MEKQESFASYHDISDSDNNCSGTDEGCEQGPTSVIQQQTGKTSSGNSVQKETPTLKIHKNVADHDVSDSGSDSEVYKIPAKKRKASTDLKRIIDADKDVKTCQQDEKEIKCKSTHSTENKEYIDQDHLYNFYITTVQGLKPQYNGYLTTGIEDILCEGHGELAESIQFNYMVDVEWLLNRYPKQFRDKPLTLVHGCEPWRGGSCEYRDVRRRHPQVQLCHAPLPIMYGTHHTKMMVLFYTTPTLRPGPAVVRIVIHTANLVPRDWAQKTQGVWLSPFLPKLSVETSPATGSSVIGDSDTGFKTDFLTYLASYKQPETDELREKLMAYDFSRIRVYLIPSVPGRHIGPNSKRYGHLKLKKVLESNVGINTANVNYSSWPVVGQFSSIGSLGNAAQSWLTGEFLTSLSATPVASTGLHRNPQLKLIYPSVENVRLSLEGYRGGDCLPYRRETHQKQKYLENYLHLWRSSHVGRSVAVPHIKSYCRISPGSDRLLWFLLTSANLSKAAWGALEKKGSQLMIRSYELGVLFLPGQYDRSSDTFSVKTTLSDRNDSTFRLPYDVPLSPYARSDSPFIVNQEYRDKPDTHGMMWCPS